MPYRCKRCGRKKFQRPCPHKCIGGFIKHYGRRKWKELYNGSMFEEITEGPMSENSVATPLPCPFCGETKAIRFSQVGYGVGQSLWRYGCYVCHADGPVTDSVEEALTFWNYRKETSK